MGRGPLTKLLLATLLVGSGGLASCASTLEPPPYPDIRIIPLADRGFLGARAEYEVRAPLSAVIAIFEDFEGRVEAHPMASEVRQLTEDEDGGLLEVRYREAVGIEGEIHLRYDIERGRNRYRVDYGLVRAPVSLWRLRGSTEVRALGSDAATAVRQQFMATTISMDRDRMLRRMRRSAEAVRAAAEGR